MRNLLLILGGLIILSAILYQAGFRIITVSKETASTEILKQDQTQSKDDLRRQQRQARTEKGQSKAAKRSARVQGGTPGSEPITVIAAGKTTSFTGADLKELEPTSVASGRGLRSGWRVEAVMKIAGVTRAKELVFVDKDGKTFSLPWEKLSNSETALILTYNRFGGLMLLSGVPMTPEEVETATNPDVKRKAKGITDNSMDRISFSGIQRIEAKPG